MHEWKVFVSKEFFTKQHKRKKQFSYIYSINYYIPTHPELF